MRDPFLLAVSCFVIFCHLLFIVWSVWVGEVVQNSSVSKPLKVQSIALNPPTKSVVQQPKKEKEQAIVPNPPTETVVQQPKKTKKSTQVAKEAPQIKKNVEKKALFKKAQESLAKINGSSAHFTSHAASTSHVYIDALKSEQLESNSISYLDQLLVSLRALLKLPEEGEVELSLTVSREGKVLNLEVMCATSEENAHYLKREIPKLLLPPLGNFFPKEEARDFVLTFKDL